MMLNLFFLEVEEKPKSKQEKVSGGQTDGFIFLSWLLVCLLHALGSVVWMVW